MAKTVSIAAYEALQAQGMKVGSKVKIMSSWPEKSEGFDAYWPSDMNSTVGKTGIVMDIKKEIDQYTVRIDVPGNECWWYPTMVLHLVESEPSDLLQVNEEVRLLGFNKDTREVTAKLNGSSRHIISYDEIKDLHKAITKTTVKIAGYDASIDHVNKHVQIGCQKVSFEAIEKAYKLTRSQSGFEVGDRVEYFRKPTDEDWKGVGEVKIPFKIGDVLTVNSISKRTGSLTFSEHGEQGYCFPHQAFRHA